MTALKFSGGVWEALPLDAEEFGQYSGQVWPGPAAPGTHLVVLEDGDRDELAGIMSRFPSLTLYVVPRLHRFGEAPPLMRRPIISLGGAHLPGRSVIFVAMEGRFRLPDGSHSILETVWHEIAHAVFSRWNDFSPEWETLSAYGDQLRAANEGFGGAFRPDWMNRDEEAEALAFGRWAAGWGGTLCTPPPPAVLALWQEMKAGRISGN